MKCPSVISTLEHENDDVLYRYNTGKPRTVINMSTATTPNNAALHWRELIYIFIFNFCNLNFLTQFSNELSPGQSADETLSHL